MLQWFELFLEIGFLAIVFSIQSVVVFLQFKCVCSLEEQLS